MFEEGQSSQSDYGPSADYTIDTTKTFTVVTHFDGWNGKFTGYTTVLSQNGRTVVLERSKCEYLEDMSDDMKNMVFVFSNTDSSDLDWLQHGSCTGECDPYKTGSVFTNMSIITKQLVPKTMSHSSALDPGPSAFTSA